MSTLLLDVVTWDLLADANGNIAMADEPYAIAQDVASEVRLFLGDVYYDINRGVPYFGSILGEAPPLQFVKTKIEQAARRVDKVVKASCRIDGIENRKLTGRILVTDVAGRDITVGL